MKKKLSQGLFVVLFMALVFVSNACAENLKMLTAYAPNFIFNIGVTNNFVKNMNTLSKGTIKISTFGPDVIPTFEQFQPLQSGIFDLSFTHATYHAGTIGVGVGMDATTTNPT